MFVILMGLLGSLGALLPAGLVLFFILEWMVTIGVLTTLPH